jgi:hypothetical protein
MKRSVDAAISREEVQACVQAALVTQRRELEQFMDRRLEEERRQWLNELERERRLWERMNIGSSPGKRSLRRSRKASDEKARKASDEKTRKASDERLSKKLSGGEHTPVCVPLSLCRVACLLFSLSFLLSMFRLLCCSSSSSTSFLLFRSSSFFVFSVCLMFRASLSLSFSLSLSPCARWCFFRFFALCSPCVFVLVAFFCTVYVCSAGTRAMCWLPRHRRRLAQHRLPHRRSTAAVRATPKRAC